MVLFSHGGTGTRERGNGMISKKKMYYILLVVLVAAIVVASLVTFISPKEHREREIYLKGGRIQCSNEIF